MEKNSEVAKLFALIKEAKHLVALTGAGVSTLSGIRDFRGKNGLYNEMDAEKILTLSILRKTRLFITIRQVPSFTILMKRKPLLFTPWESLNSAVSSRL